MSDQVARKEVVESSVEVLTTPKKSSGKKISQPEIVMSFNQFTKGLQLDKYDRAYWEHECRGIITGQEEWKEKLKDLLDG